MGALKTYFAELHVHTVLSPCAGIEMIPPLIIQEAVNQNIKLLAITDHNASANIASVQKAAQDTPVTVLPGMEIQTKEEVHTLCLFDTIEQVTTMQALVDQHLPDLQNNAEYFGEQFIVDETGEFIQREQRLLLTSTSLSFDQVFHHVEELGGLFIPAHVDREAYGLFANLGFIPPELPIEALEISTRTTLALAYQKYPSIKNYPIIQSGDVHYLDDFLGINHFHIYEPSISEIKLAFRNEEGRDFSIISSK